MELSIESGIQPSTKRGIGWVGISIATALVLVFLASVAWGVSRLISNAKEATKTEVANSTPSTPAEAKEKVDVTSQMVADSEAAKAAAIAELSLKEQALLAANQKAEEAQRMMNEALAAQRAAEAAAIQQAQAAKAVQDQLDAAAAALRASQAGAAEATAIMAAQQLKIDTVTAAQALAEQQLALQKTQAAQEALAAQQAAAKTAEEIKAMAEAAQELQNQLAQQQVAYQEQARTFTQALTDLQAQTQQAQSSQVSDLTNTQISATQNYQLSQSQEAAVIAANLMSAAAAAAADASAEAQKALADAQAAQAAFDAAKQALYLTDQQLADAKAAAQKAVQEAQVIETSLVKYIRFDNPTDYLQLAEVKIFAPDGTEIGSTNFTFAASGAYSSNTGPDKIFDSNTDGYFAHGSIYVSAGNSNQWMEMTLTNPMDVGMIEIYGRQDCCNERLATTTMILMNKNRESLFVKTLTREIKQAYNFALTPKAKLTLDTQYGFFPKLDSPGNEIETLAEKADDNVALRLRCNLVPNCEGVTTGGILKQNILPRSLLTQWTDDPVKGIYIKHKYIV